MAKAIEPAVEASGDPVEVEPAVVAHDIAVRGEEGPAYGPLDVEIPGEGLTILNGRGGSGRTALALTISGRMKVNEGEITVLGESEPKKIRNMVAIAGVESIDALDRSVKVHEILTEHRAWSKLWISWSKPADEAYRDELCSFVFGHRDLPPMDVYISQLSSLDRILLRICLALRPANGAEIKMLVMDDFEQVREQEDRLVLLHSLQRIAEKIPVVLNAVNPVEGVEHHQIELFTDEGHLQPENTGRHHKDEK
ncbi:ABC transporter ATP-binding protein [Corynebacterium pelargi]|uniref:Uncharacterized protein n=1 Tax=Corynebacterium pelargi TaxID=1471400 RepID=A0A410W659_9CORY|nr:hypothetical protein [Corynebacterium pelargi]QAU51519.1 hypothetical protein CPELA_01090 [Corynebacterium pelargi]GGG79732.1 hypothetical protein GCM10007338_17610 [Corynebacterium pelargi]